MSVSLKDFDSEELSHSLLNNRMITFLLTFLLALMVSSAIKIFYTPTSATYITSNYPLGFLQKLPLVFWITSVAYSILGFIVLTSKKLSRFNQGYLILIFLTMVALKVAIPNLITKNPVAGDSYLHHWYAETIISHGHVPEEFYWVWPGQHIFSAMFELISSADPMNTLIVLPILMLVLVVLFIYLIARRWFGQRDAFLSLFIIANLTSPLGDSAMHLCPHVMAMLFAVVFIYCKTIATWGKGNSSHTRAYTTLGLIVLSILIPTHLFIPLFVGLFLLGIYISKGRLASTAFTWILKNRALKGTFLVLILITSLVLALQRYHIPALLATFLFGIYISRMEYVRLIVKAIHNSITTKHLSIVYVPVICFLLPFLFFRHSYITLLLISSFAGIYVGGNIRVVSPTERVDGRRKLFGDDVKKIQGIVAALGLIFVYWLFWWMTRDPAAFITPTKIVEALITNFRIEFVNPVKPSSIVYTGEFSISWLWSFALDSILMILMFTGVYLSLKHNTQEKTRYTILVGGIAVLSVTLMLLTIFGAYPGRLNPWITLFGVIAMSVGVRLCYVLGLKKFSLISLTLIIVLMSLSPIGTYTPQAQARLIYNQDDAMSRFMADKALTSNPNAILTGDYRNLHMIKFKVFLTVQISEVFLDSIRNKNKAYRHGDYTLLSGSTPHRLIYADLDPSDVESKISEMQHDTNVNLIYSNGYNTLLARNKK